MSSAMLVHAARSARALAAPISRRATGTSTLRYMCSSSSPAGSDIAVADAPESTALQGSQAADVAARLEAMETEQLGLVPHEERMQQMGSMIQNEYKEAGLELTDITVGSGAEAIPGEWVRVHIKGTTEDGNEFENTLPSGSPVSFVVGSNQVVLGVDYGVAGMRVGGTRRMMLPPHLGYGFRRVGDIPPNSTLTFDVELLQVGEEAAEAPPSWWDSIRAVFSDWK